MTTRLLRSISEDMNMLLLLIKIRKVVLCTFFLFICLGAMYNDEDHMRISRLVINEALDEIFDKPLEERIIKPLTWRYKFCVSLKEAEEIIVATDGYIDAKCKYAIIYVGSAKEVIILNNEAGLPEISKLVRRDYASFPEDYDAQLKVIDAVKCLHIMLTGKIGSKRLLAKAGLDSFMDPVKHTLSYYEQFCINPKILVNTVEDNWSASFYFFNIFGGVDQIRMKGKIQKFSVDKVETHNVLEDGCFKYINTFG